MRTPVCDLLGIEQPIVQAPMSAVPELAAAVSNAGALGTLALTWSTPAGDPVRETAALTDRPFGGNLILTSDQHAPPRRGPRSRPADRVADVGRSRAGTSSRSTTPTRSFCTRSAARKRHGGRSPAASMSSWRRAGRPAGTSGVGVATLPLVPAVVDAVAPVPVIAAGGIGDARGVAAVFALGAQAAWLGTRFLLAREMPIHEEYRRRLMDAAETDAQWYADLYEVGWPDAPHRALRNSTAAGVGGGGPAAAWSVDRERAKSSRTSPPARQILRYEPGAPLVGTTGDIEALSLWAGQSVALATETQPAAEIVAELVSRL